MGGRGGQETFSLPPLAWIDLSPLFFILDALLRNSNALGVSYNINTTGLIFEVGEGLLLVLFPQGIDFPPLPWICIANFLVNIITVLSALVSHLLFIHVVISNVYRK